MKQIVQSLKDGKVSLYDVPVPVCKKNQVLIKTSYSLISSGTERMLLEFGKGGLLKKARSQPERVQQAFDKALTDGVYSTLNSIQSKLDTPIGLGYCNVGTVVESNLENFAVGERVVSNGSHAEFVTAEKNLCAKIPQNVSDEEACFVVMGAISLQGIRLSNPLIGECVGVIGLGILGLLSVQILTAQGCRVIAIDLDKNRLELAKTMGAEVIDAKDDKSVISRSHEFSKGIGLDAVLITAATSSSKPVSTAAKISRKRGKIVLVGVTGLQLNRQDFYEKELTFQVSCSYGPGRYDKNYEQFGNDYPAAFVRWTEKRNFEALLDLMSMKKIDVSKLITHRLKFEQGEKALSLLTSNENPMGILLRYRDKTSIEKTITVTKKRKITTGINAVVSFIGSGNYAKQTLLPAFYKTSVNLNTIVSQNGIAATHLAKKFGFNSVSSEIKSCLNEKKTNTIVIATRHNNHAEQILLGLEKGKHIFCEKPLCLTLQELKKIQLLVRRKSSLKLMVGYNRRYAPQIVKMKKLTENLTSPKNIIVTVNAGSVEADHWTRDKRIGGGRIVGELCHFVDLVRFLAGSKIVEHSTVYSNSDELNPDYSAHTLFRFINGSVASINYVVNGNKKYPKETVEIFCSGKVLKLENFLKLRGWGWSEFRRFNLWKQNKGQDECVKAFIETIEKNNNSIIPIEEIMEVAKVTIEISNSLKV
ncbi:MAG: dehydrogenase [Candidatus Endolissoclinum sp. TMED37]|nr:MAG: dehydrogenase [Candidatus Endolissoclinum sp. TMED37]